jgi:hypothetical protein
MTNQEQFDIDIALNANNTLFTKTDDEIMGQRGRGCYLKVIYENGHECTNIIFDNGRHYLIDNEEDLLCVCEPIPEEYFIHKYLEKVVSDFIEMWSIGGSDSEISIYCLTNEIEARTLIRLLPYRDEKIVYLTNIHMPINLRHKGLGKNLIKQVFDVCQRFNYRLVLLDVVESFSKSLEKRNAKFLDFDKIEITKETNLI